MRSSSYHSYTNGQELPIYAQICILLCAVGFTIGGIVCFYFSTFHLREHSINIFEETSRNWTNFDRPVFKSANFSVVSSLSSENSTFIDGQQNIVALHPVTSEYFHRGYGPNYIDEDLYRYKPLKHQADGVPESFFPAADFEHPSLASLKILATFNSPKAGFITSEFELDNLVPLTRRVETHAPNPAPEQKCPIQLHGIYNRRTRRCEVYEKIHTICIQVKIDNHNQWKIHREENGNYGCNPYDDWEPLHYIPVHVQKLSNNHPIELLFPKDNLTDVTITIRHHKDPYLLAEVLTNSTMDFGLKASEWRLIGGFLIFVGLLSSIQPILRFRKEKLEPRSGRGRYSRFNNSALDDSFHDLESIEGDNLDDEYDYVLGSASESERSSPITLDISESESPKRNYAPALSPVIETLELESREEGLRPAYPLGSKDLMENDDDFIAMDIEMVDCKPDGNHTSGNRMHYWQR
mmetsp:Transcript_21228/g.27853  ORF Transcript_21228/g.27853 Transcript_21228/m.27853 type:complete len:466 (+) Transcript_21228:79-1476(+)